MTEHRSATELAAAVRSGEISAQELAADRLTRSAELQPEFNAFTHLDDSAVDRAAALDRRVRSGEYPAELAGVPVAIKDLLDQAGQVTTCGSSFYRKTATRTATAVARLETAGAVVIGRTGLHEFAFGFSSENPWFGPVRNPWDPATSPGGSSGGSAAAVAAGLVPAALGTDTGGSVRVPAALCGLFGLKVTHGRVPLTGVFPLAGSLDTVGPLARHLDDLETVYEVIAGFDEADPWSPPRPVGDSLPAIPLAGLRIGLPQPWIEDGPVTAEVGTAFAGALEDLAALGARVQEVRQPALLPDDRQVDLMNGEVASVHRAWLADPTKAYGSEVEERLRGALTVTLDDYVAARPWRSRLRHATAELFESFDLLVTPTTGATRKVIGDPHIPVNGRNRSYRLVLSWFSSLVNQMGNPALAMPLISGGSPPTSLQIIGPWWSERTLLAVARSLEQAGIVSLASPGG